MAGVLALAWGWLFYGLQDFLSVLVEGESFAAHYVLESGWGLFFVVLVAVPRSSSPCGPARRRPCGR